VRLEAEELAKAMVRPLWREIDVYRQPHGEGVFFLPSKASANFLYFLPSMIV
jgi:hypothetical protein